MKSETYELPGEGFAAQVELHTDGEESLLIAHGIVIAQWSLHDPVSRDVVIAAGLRIGWKGLSLARLTRTSQAHVSRVGAKLARGGFEALLEHGRPGPKGTLGDAQIERARALRTEGHSLRTIAQTLGVALAVLGRVLKGVPAGSHALAQRELALPVQQPTAPAAPAESAPAESVPSPARVEEPVAHDLLAGAALASTGVEHDCRYAGTLLICAAAQCLGLDNALTAAAIKRPPKAAYSARVAMLSMLSAWSAGLPSLEAMHERDARAMGVVLGLERSPSVRTLHRAVGQMLVGYDPVAWSAAWMTALWTTMPPALPVFGVDGHFKPYAGDEPIDKGYDTKKRMVVRGLGSVRVMDLRGCTWVVRAVPAGDGILKHLTAMATTMRAVMGDQVPLVLGFDRGGFSFEMLHALDAAGVYYLSWVPASVSLPDLSAIAPAHDGVGEQLWTHASLRHASRLLVQRDGAATVPATTNLPTLVDTPTAMQLLRSVRGWEENGIKAARSFAHIDHLEDRGKATRRPDDRLVNNPAYVARKKFLGELAAVGAELARERPVRGARTQGEIELDEVVNTLHRRVVSQDLKGLPKKVERVTVEPGAERSELKTRNRVLLTPLKNAQDNARRWLLWKLGTHLSPSDQEWDQDARTRTLCALIHTKGRVRLEKDVVEVTLEMPLPAQPHRRLSEGLKSLDALGLHFTDGTRAVRFRLAPRPTRADLPGNPSNLRDVSGG